ncbi:MAG: hypothetical protein ACLTAI_07315 [Thomasclavelia sp.]
MKNIFIIYKSRGLSKEDAMHLVTYGYFMPVLEVVDNEMIKRTLLNEMLKERWVFNMLEVAKIQ